MRLLSRWAQSMKMKRVHMSIVWTQQIRKASFTSPPVFLLPEPDQHEESAEDVRALSESLHRQTCRFPILLGRLPKEVQGRGISSHESMKERMRRTQSVTLFNSHAARLGAKAKNRPINTDCLPHHPWLRMNEPPCDGSQQEYACQQMRDDGREPNQNGTYQLEGKQSKRDEDCCKPERQLDEFHPRFPLHQKSSYGIEGFPSNHNCLTSSWICSICISLR